MSNQRFFKGYIRLNGKKSKDRFKNVPLRTFDEVQNEQGYGGVLADDAVLVDVDDKASAEKLMAIIEDKEVLCQVRQTDKGMHFYFINDGHWTKCSTKTTLACGVVADIKVGLSNSYAVLKRDGKVREIIYDILDGEEYATPPKWLRPINTTIEVAGASEGDGRNDKLFRYILPLQSEAFSKEEIIETLSIVNDYVFDKPLPKSEFDTITRDEAFQAELVPNFYDEKKKFLFNVMAQHLISNRNVKRVNGQVHIYRDGIYEDGMKKIESDMIKILPELSKRNRNEVTSYIDILLEENTPMADACYVAFKNGILNVFTGEMLDFSPDIVITNRIDYNYNPDAKCDLVDSTLMKLACNDFQIVDLLEEMAGYCLFRRNELRKAFILTGGARGGKSTYIAMLMKMLGKENTSALDLKELGDRFKTAELYGKLANLGDDIGDDFIGDTAIFKKLVSGDRVSAERKGQDPFEFNSYAKLIFSANALPRVKDRAGAVIDRLIVIPFNAQFSKSDPDYRPFIKYELTQPDAIERLIKLGVDGLRRVLENNAFTHSDKVDAELKEYDELNNPIRVFLSEVGGAEALCTETTNHWYGAYNEFCLSNQINPLSKIEFSRQIIREYPQLVTKNLRVEGKVVRKFAVKGL